MGNSDIGDKIFVISSIVAHGDAAFMRQGQSCISRKHSNCALISMTNGRETVVVHWPGEGDIPIKRLESTLKKMQSVLARDGLPIKAEFTVGDLGLNPDAFQSKLTNALSNVVGKENVTYSGKASGDLYVDSKGKIQTEVPNNIAMKFRAQNNGRSYGEVYEKANASFTIKNEKYEDGKFVGTPNDILSFVDVPDDIKAYLNDLGSAQKNNNISQQPSYPDKRKFDNGYENRPYDPEGNIIRGGRFQSNPFSGLQQVQFDKPLFDGPVISLPTITPSVTLPDPVVSTEKKTVSEQFEEYQKKPTKAQRDPTRLMDEQGKKKFLEYVEKNIPAGQYEIRSGSNTLVLVNHETGVSYKVSGSGFADNTAKRISSDDINNLIKKGVAVQATPIDAPTLTISYLDDNKNIFSITTEPIIYTFSDVGIPSTQHDAVQRHLERYFAQNGIAIIDSGQDNIGFIVKNGELHPVIADKGAAKPVETLTKTQNKKFAIMCQAQLGNTDSFDFLNASLNGVELKFAGNCLSKEAIAGVNSKFKEYVSKAVSINDEGKLHFLGQHVSTTIIAENLFDKLKQLHRDTNLPRPQVEHVNTNASRNASRDFAPTHALNAAGEVPAAPSRLAATYASTHPIAGAKNPLAQTEKFKTIIAYENKALTLANDHVFKPAYEFSKPVVNHVTTAFNAINGTDARTIQRNATLGSGTTGVVLVVKGLYDLYNSGVLNMDISASHNAAVKGAFVSDAIGVTTGLAADIGEFKAINYANKALNLVDDAAMAAKYGQYQALASNAGKILGRASIVTSVVSGTLDTFAAYQRGEGRNAAGAAGGTIGGIIGGVGAVALVGTGAGAVVVVAVGVGGALAGNWLGDQSGRAIAGGYLQGIIDAATEENLMATCKNASGIVKTMEKAVLTVKTLEAKQEEYKKALQTNDLYAIEVAKKELGKALLTFEQTEPISTMQKSDGRVAAFSSLEAAFKEIEDVKQELIRKQPQLATQEEKERCALAMKKCDAMQKLMTDQIKQYGKVHNTLSRAIELSPEEAKKQGQTYIHPRAMVVDQANALLEYGDAKSAQIKFYNEAQQFQQKYIAGMKPLEKMEPTPEQQKALMVYAEKQATLLKDVNAGNTTLAVYNETSSIVKDTEKSRNEIRKVLEKREEFLHQKQQELLATKSNNPYTNEYIKQQIATLANQEKLVEHQLQQLTALEANTALIQQKAGIQAERNDILLQIQKSQEILDEKNISPARLQAQVDALNGGLHAVMGQEDPSVSAIATALGVSTKEAAALLQNPEALQKLQPQLPDEISERVAQMQGVRERINSLLESDLLTPQERARLISERAMLTVNTNTLTTLQTTHAELGDNLSQLGEQSNGRVATFTRDGHDILLQVNAQGQVIHYEVDGVQVTLPRRDGEPPITLVDGQGRVISNFAGMDTLALQNTALLAIPEDARRPILTAIGESAINLSRRDTKDDILHVDHAKEITALHKTLHKTLEAEAPQLSDAQKSTLLANEEIQQVIAEKMADGQIDKNEMKDILKGLKGVMAASGYGNVTKNTSIAQHTR